MPNDLSNYLDSEYIKANRSLLPKTAATKVEVYVESDEDVAFWRHVLHPYEKGTMKFSIQSPVKKGKQSLVGKSADLLSMVNKTGSHLILCVDSDYDYILQGATDQSKLIIEHPYVFHTYAYSIENLHCYSGSLHNICVAATKNDEVPIDLEELLEKYSKIIYPLFLWNVYLYRQEDTTTFSISEFCDVARLIGSVDIDTNCRLILEELSQRVKAKVAELQEHFPIAYDEFEKLARELQQMGINRENAYLFVHGHTLKNRVVLFILKALYMELERKKRVKISSDYATNKIELKQQHSHYNNKLKNVEDVLDLNTDFESCFLFEKITNDIISYVNKSFPDAALT